MRMVCIDCKRIMQRNPSKVKDVNNVRCKNCQRRFFKTGTYQKQSGNGWNQYRKIINLSKR